MPGWGSPGAEIKHRVIVGQVFGELTVLDPDARKPQSYAQARDNKPGTRAPLCRCSCGRQAQPDIYQLLSGKTRSCGCGKADRLRTHGMTGHYLYRTWGAMLQRCENPNDDGYKDYGARGIRVCAAWHDSGTFMAWIKENLGPRPDGCSMDRIDNDGNYEPGNVRWNSASGQQNNKRRGKFVLDRPGAPRLTLDEREDLARNLTAKGVTGREIARILGVSPAAVCHYLAKARA